MTARCQFCDRETVSHDICDACIAENFIDPDDCEPSDPAFECAGFNDGSGFYCPMWGTEECDWDCPNGGMEP